MATPRTNPSERHTSIVLRFAVTKATNYIPHAIRTSDLARNEVHGAIHNVSDAHTLLRTAEDLYNGVADTQNAELIHAAERKMAEAIVRLDAANRRAATVVKKAKAMLEAVETARKALKTAEANWKAFDDAQGVRGG